MLRKKWLSLLVAISMVAAMFPSTVFADADSTELDTTAPTSQTSTEVPEEETPGTEEGEQPNVTDDTTATGEADKGTNESEEDETVVEETEEETKEPETPAKGTEEKTEDAGETASEEADTDEETTVVPPVTTPEVTENQTANNGIATMAETRTEYPFETGGTGYATLADAVKAVSEGGTITLTQDLDGAPGVSVPSGKQFTLDFGGHTYTLKNPGAGSTGTETNGFQLLRDSTITFTNGTIRISEENGNGDGNPIMRVIQNYANLTLEDMQIYAVHQYGSEDYVLSFNNGNITFKGNTSIYTTKPDAIAFDVCYWQRGGYDDGTYVTFDDDYRGTIDGTIVYDSTDKDKGKLTIKGSGNFVGIKTSESSDNGVSIEISGGTFENSFPAEYLVGNVALKEQADGTFKVDKDTPVAKIGEDTYPTLEAAVKAAESDSTITLLEDVYLGKMLTLDKPGVKLDLKGHTISASVDFVDPTPTGSKDATSNDNHLIDVTANGVTITNGTLKAGRLNNHTLNIWNASNVTLDGVTLDGSGAGIPGAPLVLGGSSATLNGTVTVVTDKENSWYGVNLDSKNGEGFELTVNGKLVFNGENQNNAGIWVEDQVKAGSDKMKVTFSEGSSAQGNGVEGFEIVHIVKTDDGTQQGTVTGGENAGLITDEDGNYIVKPAPAPSEPATGSSHEHSYVWQGSPDEHWQYCTDCGQVVGNGAHTFQWKDGAQVCSVCGYKVTKTATASAPAGSAKTAAAAPAAGTAAAAVATGIPQTGDASNPMLWVVLLAVSGSALGGLMVYKKKKEN